MGPVRPTLPVSPAQVLCTDWRDFSVAKLGTLFTSHTKTAWTIAWTLLNMLAQLSFHW